MILKLILAFLLPFLIGFIISNTCFKSTGLRAGVIKGSLGIGLGIGICSLLYFLLLPISHSLGAVLIVEFIFLIGTFIVSYLANRSARFQLLAAEEPGASEASDLDKLPVVKIAFLLYVFSLGNALLSFVLKALVNPHGYWDAWAIWNLRARFIYRSMGDWSKIFSATLNYSHTDYPLLLPSFIARTWLYLQHETIYAPICIAGLFALAIVGLLTSSTIILRGKMQGYLAGLALLSTPFFVEHATAQYADVPLAFFFLAVIVLLTFAEQLIENKNALYLLAGVMGGLATWTKNEGLLFLTAVILSRVVAAYMDDWKIKGKSVSYFVIGLAPILIVLIYFKVHFAPVNDLVNGQNSSIFHKLTSPSRYYLIINSFISTGMNFGGWIVSPIILPIIYALVFGAYSGLGKRNIANVLAITFTLAGYFFVYITTPHDLAWHLNTSLDRLMLQLYPSILFSYFMLVASPTQILQPKLKDTIVLS